MTVWCDISGNRRHELVQWPIQIDDTVCVCLYIKWQDGECLKQTYVRGLLWEICYLAVLMCVYWATFTTWDRATLNEWLICTSHTQGTHCVSVATAPGRCVGHWPLATGVSGPNYQPVQFSLASERASEWASERPCVLSMMDASAYIRPDRNATATVKISRYEERSP